MIEGKGGHIRIRTQNIHLLGDGEGARRAHRWSMPKGGIQGERRIWAVVLEVDGHADDYRTATPSIAHPAELFAVVKSDGSWLASVISKKPPGCVL